MFKKSIVFSILVFLFANSVFAAGYIKDGVYAFDYERVLVSLDAAELYKAYGINMRQDITKLATGAAVMVKDGAFVDPESGVIIKINAGGKIKSPDNQTIQGNYSKDGKITFFGNYLENEQTVQMVVEGTLVFSKDSDRAGKNFNGKYSATDPGTNRKQTIWIENGLYMWQYEDKNEDDFSGWPMVINKDGSFNYVSEYTTRAIMYGMSDTTVTSRTYTQGKFEPNGSLSLKIITENVMAGQVQSEPPVVYSAIKATDTKDVKNTSTPIYTAMDEKGNKEKRSKNAAVFGADKAEGKIPSWYNEELVIDGKNYFACGKRRNQDAATAKKLAEGIAVNQIVAYMGTEVTSSTVADRTNSQKYLYKELESIAIKQTNYEVVESLVDDSTGWAYVKVRIGDKMTARSVTDPEWYTEDVTVTDEYYETNAKRDALIAGDFTTAYLQAEQDAIARMKDYLAEIGDQKTLDDFQEELYGYKMDYSNNFSYVTIRVQNKSPKPKEEPKKKEEKKEVVDEIKTISSFPRVLIGPDGDRYTLVDAINIASEESKESHHLAFVETKKISTSKDSYYYPDGVLFSGSFLKVSDGDLQFNLKNVIKGRKTIIIIQTDANNAPHKMNLTICKNKHSGEVDQDKKNRMRNCHIEVGEGEITEYSPQCVLSSEDGVLIVSQIYVYQVL